MKKHYFNPNERFFGILSMIILMVTIIALSISAFIEIINHSFETSKLWIILAIFTLPIMLLIACIVYIKKYSGYFYIEDDSLILMKHRKK